MPLPPARGNVAAMAQLLTVAAFTLVAVDAAEFNFEFAKRVIDHVSSYMEHPIDINTFMSNAYQSGGLFPNDLRAPDRDVKLTIDHALTLPMVYYGLEDGLMAMGNFPRGGKSFGYYREPGNSGFALDDPKMQKYLGTCVDGMDGSPRECVMAPGAPFISCAAEGCDALDLCPDEDSQRNCSAHGSYDEIKTCESKRKFCRVYEIKNAPNKEENVMSHVTLGFVPLTTYCHDERGFFSQEPGMVVQNNDESGAMPELGSCYYGNGETLVQRNVTGDFAYCGGNGEDCSGTFVGGFESGDFDPRYRPWYITTKEKQRPTWSDPYPFYDNLGLGITATHPIYDSVEGKQIFAGVLATDYRFTHISSFLLDAYGDSSTAIAIVEDAEPNYIIGLSTGTPAAKLVLSENQSEPCVVTDSQVIPCDPVRIPMSELSNSGNSMDRVLALSLAMHKEASYPEHLVTVRESMEVGAGVFLSQSALYEQPGANLRWRVIVTSPGDKSSSDSIEVGHPLFGAIIAIGAVGVLACIGLFLIFYRKRKDRVVMFADWRFTSAFILGCALFNGTTFTLLGPNTNATCLLRMWSFHVCFVVALSPLFVKVWRIKQLVGQSVTFRRKSISNTQAALYCLPLVAVQIMICTFISIFDPPHPVEMNRVSDGIITQQIVCQVNTNALFITEVIFETGLVVVGCVLAFQTKDLDKRFGESKQLIFAMYNIALIALLFAVVPRVASIEPNGRSTMQAVGVFWGTVFSSAAFVVPRLLQVRKKEEMTRLTATVRSEQHSTLAGQTTLPGHTTLQSTHRRSSAGEQV